MADPATTGSTHTTFLWQSQPTGSTRLKNMAACEQPCLAWSLICAPPPESPRQRRRRDDDDARQAAQVAQARRSANARQCAPFARDAAFEAFDAQARFAATTPTTPSSLRPLDASPSPSTSPPPVGRRRETN